MELMFDLDLRLESVEASSSSSRRRVLEESEPIWDRPTLDRPKLNMVSGEMEIDLFLPRLSSFYRITFVRVRLCDLEARRV